MTNTYWSPKDPDDKRDYYFDFGPLGLGSGETITAATVSIEADQHEPVDSHVDLEKLSDGIVDGTWVVIRVAGGTPAEYTIQYHVTTSTGQELDLTKTLEVKERTAS